MKFTVSGINQQRLVELGLNLQDASILRWLIDFQNTGQMVSVIEDGKTYYWVDYHAILRDLPAMTINSVQVIGRRFKEYERLGILEKMLYKKRGGTYSFFRFLPEGYTKLLPYKIDESYDNTPPWEKVGNTKNSVKMPLDLEVRCSEKEGGSGPRSPVATDPQVQPKDPSINDPSINDYSIPPISPQGDVFLDKEKKIKKEKSAQPEQLTNPAEKTQQPEKTQTVIEAEKIAVYLDEKIKREHPAAKNKTDSWIKDIEAALRIDHRTEEQLVGLIDYIFDGKGGWWKSKVLSGKKLRAKFDTIYMQSLDASSTSNQVTPDIPTKAEVEAYCNKTGRYFNANRFFNHYQARGWMFGNTPILDWKAQADQWITSNKNYEGQNPNSIDAQVKRVMAAEFPETTLSDQTRVEREVYGETTK